MGTPELAVPTLAALAARHELVAVATQPDRASGRGRRLQASPVKAWALENGVAVLQPTNLRTPEAVAPLAALAPDVIVVVAYGLLLPAAVLALPRLGCINLHASLLPRHRGASPVQAAILAGDRVTGVTTMLMDEGLDTGPTLLSAEVVVDERETAGSLTDRLGQVGAPLVLETLAGLADGTLLPAPQDHALATLTRRILKEDGLIRWEQPAATIERLVRAMQPWPVAATWLGSTRLQVWRATVDGDPESGREQDSAAVPGTVVGLEGGIRVSCGDRNVLVIEELQRPGGKRLRSEDFLRGFALDPGARLTAAPE